MLWVMIDEQNENVYELAHRTVQPFPIDVEPFWILYHDLMGVAWIKDPFQCIPTVLYVESRAWERKSK